MHHAKKLRQEQAASAPHDQRRAVTEEEKAAKRLKIWSAVFYVIIGLMVIGIAVAAIANTGVLGAPLPLSPSATTSSPPPS